MLSMHTRYALKALMHLTVVRCNDPHSTLQISDATGISRKFLETILLQLKRANIVTSRMGKSGGYALARAPEQITIAEIIRIMEGPIALLPCASKNFYRRCETCVDEETCGLRKIMTEARERILDVLEGSTVADAVLWEEGVGIAPG